MIFAHEVFEFPVHLLFSCCFHEQAASRAKYLLQNVETLTSSYSFVPKIPRTWDDILFLCSLRRSAIKLASSQMSRNLLDTNITSYGIYPFQVILYFPRSETLCQKHGWNKMTKKDVSRNWHYYAFHNFVVCPSESFAAEGELQALCGDW